MLLLVFSILSHHTYSQVCEAYTCKHVSDYFLQNTCIYYTNISAIPTYYASTCYDSQASYCPPVQNSNSTCTLPPKVKYLKYPGEKCHSDLDCNEFSTGCVKQTCMGKSLGENCLGHEYCNPGLKCSQTCALQLPIGNSQCTTDFDCVNNAGCNKAENENFGTCVEYFSLQANTLIKNCIENSSPLCESNSCKNSQCIDPVQSVNVPQKCKKNSDCVSTDQSLNSECRCGKNRNGNSYCDLFYGDKAYLKYFEIVKEWQKSGFVMKCNTVRRFSPVCAGDRWDRKQSYYMNYYLYYSSQFADVVEFDLCIGKIYLAEYLEVKGFLNDIEFVISASLMLVPVLLIV